MDKKLQAKLTKYGMLVAAISGAQGAQGQIIYTDETPDFAGAVGSQYFLDLNNDGTNDFRIFHNGSSNLYVAPLGANNNVLGSGGATFAYPFALAAGAAISSGAGTFFNNGFSGGFQSLNYGSCNFGAWCTVTDRYLGFQFNIGANTHYGWARLDVNAAGSVWTVKDYAYEATAGVAIAAGAVGVPAVLADTAGTILGSDIADNMTGLDLQVDFNAATNENTLSEYRMIAVAAASVGAFTLANAQALPAADYVVVPPTGATTYTQTFSAIGTDSDGNPIVNGQPYSIFVLSVADGVNANTDAMNNSATNITLVSVPADVAGAIVGTDVANNANGLDLQIDFTAGASEATLNEYRMIAVPTISAGAFTLAGAQALAAANYVSVLPTGAATYTELFTATTLDSDGNAIVDGQAYFIFILSIADGVNAAVDAMNNSATDVTLINTTPADIAGTIVGTDVANNANGLDLQIDFTAGASEATLSEYRMIAVPTASAGAFTLAGAQALVAANYVSVLPTGAATYTELFTATTLDSDGNAIVEGQAYSIFILSIADGVNAVVDAMNNSTADVTLISTVGINEYISKEIDAYSTQDGITVKIPNHLIGTSINASLYSLEGKLIKNVALTELTTTIQTDGFSSSIYILNLIDTNGNTQSIKIMK